MSGPHHPLATSPQEEGRDRSGEGYKGEEGGVKAKRKHTTRNERRWREIARIVGPGVHKLPAFFRHGLYHLRSRGGLADAELVLAYQRCRSWLRRAKDGIGECECGCGMRMAVDAKNTRGQSVWALDHDDRSRAFRGILFWRCNLEIAEGDRKRKWSHASYIDAHEARIQQDVPIMDWQTEWPPPCLVY